MELLGVIESQIHLFTILTDRNDFWHFLEFFSNFNIEEGLLNTNSERNPRYKYESYHIGRALTAQLKPICCGKIEGNSSRLIMADLDLAVCEQKLSPYHTHHRHVIMQNDIFCLSSTEKFDKLERTSAVLNCPCANNWPLINKNIMGDSGQIRNPSIWPSFVTWKRKCSGTLVGGRK